jgi:O-antigen ligase
MSFFNNLKLIAPYLFPLTITFSRSLADITIIIFSLLFIFKSFFENNWSWLSQKWFQLAIIFFVYCVFFNSSLSINPEESLKYSFFFLRWPIFAAACCYWIFTDHDSLKKFLFTMLIVVIFLIFDTWYQYFIGFDIFGREAISYRLTGPFRRPYVGMWISKLILLPLFLFVLVPKFKKILASKYFFILLVFFISLFFSTVFITGERMALLMTFGSITLLVIGLIQSKIISFYKVIIIFFSIILINVIFYLIYPQVFDRAINSTFFKIINWQDSDYGLVWRSAYDVWIGSPFMGAGLHQYRDACAQLGIYGTVDNAVGGGVCFHPHNISMQLLSETGIVGFVLFFSMVFLIAVKVLKSSYKYRDWLFFYLTLNIIFASFLPIQSNTDFFSNKYSSIVWLLIGVTLALEKIKRNGYLTSTKFY